MNKSELVAKVAKSAGISKSAAAAAVDAFIQAVENMQKQHGKVTLGVIGSFSVVTRQARVGRNPATGERIQIPATKVLKFTPSKFMKQYVRA